MAQYKVPQDVEADDKLLGPFSFRQFVYLMITGGLIALAVGLFQLFPVLAIIPLPFILFFGIMALPLRRDQPMETYFAALLSYYTKPKTRVWRSGQRDFTITILAPKHVKDEDRKRNITGEEATHRLSFLANIVDTEGQAIKGAGYDHVSAELALEADQMQDMFEQNNFNNFQASMQRGETQRHQEMVQAMREHIIESNTNAMSNITNERVETGPNYGSTAVVMPGMGGAMQGSPVQNVAVPTVGPLSTSSSPRSTNLEINPATVATPSLPSDLGGGQKNRSATTTVSNPLLKRTVEKSEMEQKKEKKKISNNPSIIELASNSAYSVATIEKEAKRIKERDKGEVFISLH